MPWTQREVAGHRCDVFQPARPHPAGLVLLYLHGLAGEGVDELEGFLEEFEQRGLAVVAPWTGPSWWSDRICEEFDPRMSAEQHVLRRILPAVEQWFGGGSPRLGLFGVDMGGQGALRLAYKHPQVFPVVAGVAPALDYHQRMERDYGDPLWRLYSDPEEARQDSALLHIHPLNWPRFQFFCCDPEDYLRWDGADRLRMKLYSLGVPHEIDLDTSCGGSEREYLRRTAPATIQFLTERLEKAARSV